MSYGEQGQPYEDPYANQEQFTYENPENNTAYESSTYQYTEQTELYGTAPPQPTPPQTLRQPLQQLKRVQSGIPGFDQIAGGGLIQGRVYLLSGPAGAGKTIFSTQFIHQGLTRFAENGVYVVLEETPQQLRENMFNSFSWDLQTYEESGNMIILDAVSSRLGLGSQEPYIVPRPFTLEALLYEIERAVEATRATRVVVDSLDAMSLELTQADLRSLIQRLTMILKSFGCTTLLVGGQMEPGSAKKGAEEYVVDGVIRLHHALEESVSGETLLEQNAVKGNSLEEDSFSMKMRARRIEILKMRGTPHSKFLHPFTIGENGLEVRSEPEVTKRVRRAIFKAKQVD